MWTLYFQSVVSLLLLSSHHLSGRRVDVYTWCGFSRNLECRSEMCCTQLAGNTGRKNDAKNRHLRTIAQLCPAISSTNGKKLLSINISCIRLHNIANFGSLAAVWGTPANFNGFRELASLLQRRHSLEANQTARCSAVSWAGTLYAHFRGLLPPDGILSCTKFTLRPSLAFSYWQRYCVALHQRA